VAEVVTVEERESEPEAAAQVGMVRAEVPEVEAGLDLVEAERAAAAQVAAGAGRGKGAANG
jgi:hypothetical protein